MTEITKHLGICMDHSSAHFIEFEGGNNDTKTIESKFTHVEKQHSISKSENLMHHKEQHQQHEFYKKLGDSIRQYTHVLLFGPTKAKTELLNVLKADHNFANIHFTVKESDKMSDKQQHAFVRDFFTKQV
ncbi:MAG: hypothetical protein IT236_12530 [Bacteroidia bacterium]|nr:hypothetical protein [Bacteroidia bacterium]